MLFSKTSWPTRAVDANGAPFVDTQTPMTSITETRCEKSSFLTVAISADVYQAYLRKLISATFFVPFVIEKSTPTKTDNF